MMAARDPSAASARIADVMRTDVRSELESGRCQHGDRNDGSGSRVVDRDRGRPSRRCGLHEAGLGHKRSIERRPESGQSATAMNLGDIRVADARVRGNLGKNDWQLSRFCKMVVKTRPKA